MSRKIYQLTEIELDEAWDVAYDRAYCCLIGEESCLDYEERLESYTEEIFDAVVEEMECAKRKHIQYNVGFDCLLESVFVPDMTDRQQEKSMQERLRDEEEETAWYSIDNYDGLFGVPFERVEAMM